MSFQILLVHELCCRYRRKAYWCEWFRHHRYEPLRSQFISQRSKSFLERASGSMGVYAPPPSLSATPPLAPSVSQCGFRPPHWSNESIEETLFEEQMGPPSSPSEVLGPDPLSVLCLTQFLKHKDAVHAAYTNQELGKSFPVQLTTHVDCRNSKGYVPFRWYSDSIIEELTQQRSSQNPLENSLSAIGCINIQHWMKKLPKGQDVSLPASSKQLVGLDLTLEKVISTFQVVPPDQGAVSLETTRRPDRTRNHNWKSVDEMIWTAASKFGLLTPEIIQQQQTVPFPSDLTRSDNSWTACGCHKNARNPSRVRNATDALPEHRHSRTEDSGAMALLLKSENSLSDINVLPDYMRPAYLAMHSWIPKPHQIIDFHVSQRSLDFEAVDLQKQQPASHGSPCYRIGEPPSDLADDCSSGDLCLNSPSAGRMDSGQPAPTAAAASEQPSSTENMTFLGTSPSFHCFHIKIGSASIPNLDLKQLLRTLPPSPSKARRIGIFCSIGGRPGDQTHLVTQCICSIQSELEAIMSLSGSLDLKSPPRVFVALCIQGEYSSLDCEARYIIAFSTHK